MKFLKRVLTNSGNGDIITMLENKFDLFLRNKLTKLIFKISDKNCKNEKIIRRQKMKKLLKLKKLTAAALACVVATMCLTACKGKGSSGGESTITIGYFEGEFLDIHWKSWEKLYNEAHPDAKITLELEGDPAYGSSIENLLSTGQVPDIMVAPMSWRKYASKGWLEPLGGVYSSSFGNGMTLESALNDEIKDNIKYNGEYYSVPFSEYMTGIVVNKGFFDEHNWKIPETMDDMLDIIDKISKLPENTNSDTGDDIYPFTWSGVNAAYYWNYSMNTWWANYGGIEEIRTFKKMASPSVYKTTAREKAVDALLSLIGGKDAPKNSGSSLGANLTDSQMDFANGKALMTPSASWLETGIQEVVPEGFEMALIAPPTIEGGTNEKNIYGHVDEWLVIPKAAENKSAAKKFVSFIFSEKGLLDFFEKTNTTSTFKVDYTKADTSQLSEFSKSVLSLRMNNNVFYRESSSALMAAGIANFWQYTQVTEMATQGKTAAQIIEYDYNNVVKDWSYWNTQI